ncbi:hypothetical protein [Singulisphaera sp. PoT]|uniref:hypothetical protein n=1 Tax=Singulisphaera sp. PoT TaxID=3411797 RepID=UPI003BF52984
MPEVMPWGENDFVITDKEGRWIVLVDIKINSERHGWDMASSEPMPFDHSPFASTFNPEFVLTVDPSEIRLYRANPGRTFDADSPLVTLPTAGILKHYDDEFGSKRVFLYYLSSLVEAWIRDLAYHWKSASPPGLDRLAGTGFVEKIEGGSTQPLEV